MQWDQIWTIIGINIALFAALATLIIWVLSKVDSDIKSIGDRVDKLGNRLDGHSQRIDQLYKMFVDLLKERRNP
jgi:DNA anti-recombination protein RmuC